MCSTNPIISTAQPNIPPPPAVVASSVMQRWIAWRHKDW